MKEIFYLPCCCDNPFGCLAFVLLPSYCLSIPGSFFSWKMYKKFKRKRKVFEALIEQKKKTEKTRLGVSVRDSTTRESMNI